MRRLSFLIAAALMLAGCNMVVSETPILTTADAEGAPQLRPGVWVRRVEGCEVDLRKKVKDWPECADVSIITRNTIGDPGKDEAMPYVLAGGTPQLMQLEMKAEDAPRLFFFVGVEPVRSDDRGRVIEARTWAVQCGPPPRPAPEEAESAEVAAPAEDSASEAPLTEAEQEAAMAEAVTKMASSMVTREPLPGLELKDGMCLVRTIEPLRNAAEKSKAWDEQANQPIVWVRDRTD